MEGLNRVRWGDGDQQRWSMRKALPAKGTRKRAAPWNPKCKGRIWGQNMICKLTGVGTECMAFTEWEEGSSRAHRVSQEPGSYL